MPDEEEKNPVGRPSEYRPEFCEKLIAHMREGNPFRTFGAIVGVSHETLYNWARHYPAFLDAKKKAVESCEHYWVKLGKLAALGQIENFNATAFVWMTKNILRWTDRISAEHSGPEGGPIQISDSNVRGAIADPETRTLIRKLSKKLGNEGSADNTD